MEASSNNFSIVLLDDDDAAMFHLKQLVSNTKKADIIATFNDPIIFMRDLPQLHFDLLMLDIEMPGMNGKTIIKRVGKEHCIVVTGSKPRYEEVIKCHPIDILIKPATELHLQRALEKARIILAQPLRSKEYYAFQTAGSSDKINIKQRNPAMP